MPARFSYSLNGENYVGAFPTRDDALAGGIEAVGEAARDPMSMVGPQTIFVARRVEADPHAAGHAKTILREMAWQAHDEVGGPARNYLRQLSEEQVRDLDGAIEGVLYDWLRRHDLLPTYFRVEGISEHLAPAAPSMNEGGSEGREVKQVGQSADAPG